jgi:hypothetical protein
MRKEEVKKDTRLSTGIPLGHGARHCRGECGFCSIDSTVCTCMWEKHKEANLHVWLDGVSNETLCEDAREQALRRQTTADRMSIV